MASASSALKRPKGKRVSASTVIAKRANRKGKHVSAHKMCAKTKTIVR